MAVLQARFRQTTDDFPVDAVAGPQGLFARIYEFFAMIFTFLYSILLSPWKMWSERDSSKKSVRPILKPSATIRTRIADLEQEVKRLGTAGPTSHSRESSKAAERIQTLEAELAETKKVRNNTGHSYLHCRLLGQD